MIASFDIGIKNFAFAVKRDGEFVLVENVNLLGDFVTKNDLNKTPKSALVEMMDRLNLDSKGQIKKTMVESILTAQKKSSPKQRAIDLGVKLFETMDRYRSFWTECDTFLVERQMVSNMQALKLSHYLEAYLKIHYPDKSVVNYSASNKTRKLGAPPLPTKPDRKRWTVEYAASILTGRHLDKFQSCPKKDDLADVVCMIEAYQKM
ncbi:hypothetical protein MIV097L [Invertebrate iridescent virus 3]|uniref:Uncharacterized protein 97L n=1 Tax=Invertebrate iridescent virus 3 TaxID=345201 RepID=VF170_IIV3|nr:hypothetical protein MIV097L [Invertebrate iridescent virus 3]Q196W3.1 RecName: Full=Uncharacterized protein 97L [Invertebrate iridescent virus 3]ABF82127.1 hypothetical protein MIV097L [Invertebrate iridescent virus 3]